MFNQNLETNENNSFTKLLGCQYCGEYFSKSNKPLILKCGHNICQICHEINLDKLRCLICNSKYEAKENIRHPINFLLLEIIERSLTKDSDDKKEKKLPAHKNKFKKTKNQKALQASSHHKEMEHEVFDFFHCLNCDLNFPNKFHLENFPDHVFNGGRKKTISEEKSQLLQKSKELMTKYQNFNEELEKKNDNFFDFLNDRMKVVIFDVLSELKSKNAIENLMIFGLINKGDKEKLNEFITKYLYDENIAEIIKKSDSFDELFFNLKKVKDFKANTFISSYFFLQDIFENKLKIDTNSRNLEYLEEKIGTFISKLESVDYSESSKNIPDDIKSLFKYFSQDLNVETYDSLDLEKDITKKYKLPSILLKQQDLIVFDPLIEKEKTFNKLNTLFPDNFNSLYDYSYYLDSDYTIYITGGIIGTNENTITSIISSDFFSLHLPSKSLKLLRCLPEARYSHSSILVNNKLFVIGGKTDTNIPIKSCYKYNFEDNTWNKIQNIPYEFKKKPILLNFENEYIYVFEDLKHFFYYDIKGDTWTTCHPTYKDAYNLNIENFVAIYLNGNVLIMGGVYLNDHGKYVDNSNIYQVKDIGSLVTKKGEFKLMDNTSLIDYGYVIDYNYLIEYNVTYDKLRKYKTKDLSSLKWDLLD